MEDLNKVDTLVQKWLPEIKAWNLHAVLPTGFELADGVNVSPLRILGYYEWGKFRSVADPWLCIWRTGS